MGSTLQARSVSLLCWVADLAAQPISYLSSYLSYLNYSSHLRKIASRVGLIAFSQRSQGGDAHVLNPATVGVSSIRFLDGL